MTTETKTEKRVALRGSVSEINEGVTFFQFQPIYGEKVRAYAPKWIFDELAHLLNEGGDHARLLVKGIGVYRQNELAYLMQVDTVSLISPLDISAQLDELRNLKDGWADGVQHARDWGQGYGKAPSHEGLDWLGDKLKSEYPDDLPLPRIYPTPEGGVQMEWVLGGFEAEIEVNLEKREGEWLWIEVTSEDVVDTILNLDDSDSWVWIACELRSLEASPG